MSVVQGPPSCVEFGSVDNVEYFGVGEEEEIWQKSFKLWVEKRRGKRRSHEGDNSNTSECKNKKVENKISDSVKAKLTRNVIKLVKDGFIIRKPLAVHSRARVQRNKEARRKGRHGGSDKRTGPTKARLPKKVEWIRRTRLLRRFRKEYREAEKMDRHLYHELYMYAGLLKNSKVFNSPRTCTRNIFPCVRVPPVAMYSRNKRRVPGAPPPPFWKYRRRIWKIPPLPY